MGSENSRLGFHFRLADRHYSSSDLTNWLQVLDQLGAKWVTLQASLSEEPVPSQFIENLKQSGLNIIIHIPSKVQELNQDIVTSHLKAYAGMGIEYVTVFDRPNLRENWGTPDWSRSNLIERFIDHLFPILKLQASFGLNPVFPPLEPGGDYWDTVFLEASLESLYRRDQDHVLRKMTLGLYSWTHGKPLDWGKGGPDQWPDTRPYHTPAGSQDQLGFRIFEWYASIAESVTGNVLPILVIAGGETPQPERRRTPSNDGIDINLSIAQSFLETDIPRYVLNFSFYPLTPEDDKTTSAWYLSPDLPSASAKSLTRMQTVVEKKPTGSAEKVIDHYVLFSEKVANTREWVEVGPYALSARPAIGFSVDEAQRARKVTLVGDEKSIPEWVEQELIAAGCEVHRIYGRKITERLFDSSVQSSTDILVGVENVHNN